MFLTFNKAAVFEEKQGKELRVEITFLDLAVKERPMGYQLVGEVRAHQG